MGESKDTSKNDTSRGDISTFDSYDKDQQRLLERIQLARRSMLDGELENKRKGDIVNAIMAEKESVPGLKELVARLEDSNPDLWKYIRRLEYIDKQIRCPKCNSFRTTPVVDGRIPQDDTVGDISNVNLPTSAISSEELNLIVDTKINEIRNLLNVQLFQLEKKIKQDIAISLNIKM